MGNSGLLRFLATLHDDAPLYLEKQLAQEYQLGRKRCKLSKRRIES